MPWWCCRWHWRIAREQNRSNSAGDWKMNVSTKQREKDRKTKLIWEWTRSGFLATSGSVGWIAEATCCLASHRVVSHRTCRRNVLKLRVLKYLGKILLEKASVENSTSKPRRHSTMPECFSRTSMSCNLLTNLLSLGWLHPTGCLLLLALVLLKEENGSGVMGMDANSMSPARKWKVERDDVVSLRARVSEWVLKDSIASKEDHGISIINDWYNAYLWAMARHEAFWPFVSSDPPHGSWYFCRGMQIFSWHELSETRGSWWNDDAPSMEMTEFPWILFSTSIPAIVYLGPTFHRENRKQCSIRYTGLYGKKTTDEILLIWINLLRQKKLSRGKGSWLWRKTQKTF